MSKPNLSGPLLFEPIFMERIWGGRRLESEFGKNSQRKSELENHGKSLIDQKRKVLS
jgi:hypothetical protein